MPNTYSQIYIQYVFAVQGRQNQLLKPWRDEVFKYISGVIKEKKSKANHSQWPRRPCACFCGYKTIHEHFRFGTSY